MSTASAPLIPPFSFKIQCKPFVKWAGGKSQLLSELKGRVPRYEGRYLEPFIGGGALFFALQPKSALIGDVNPELVNAYRVVRDQVEDLIYDLERHVHSEEYYYELRDQDRYQGFTRWSPVRKASRFIYLNKTCFNGLYRVNRSGFFNVPFGRYKNPNFIDAENLRACSQALQGAEIFECRFQDLLKKAESGDFVYLDPPYAPLSDTSNFTSYTKGGFSSSDQEALRDACRTLDQKGVLFLHSNSSAESIRNLYKKFFIESVLARRSINATAEKRGEIPELLISNYREQHS